MNISVSLTDEFMLAVKNDDNWNLRFPDYENCKDTYNQYWDGDIEKWESNDYPVKVYQTVKARDLLKEISKASWTSGEPGINFQTTMNNANPNKHINSQVFTNP